MKCDKGLIITFPAGYSAGSDREKAFRKAAPKLDVIQTQPSGFMAQEGYKTASQIIPAHKSEITWVYTENDSLADGVIQALKENGLHPGKDVLVVGGVCHGDTTNLLNGVVDRHRRPGGVPGRLVVGAIDLQIPQHQEGAGRQVYLPADAEQAAFG